MAFAHAFNMANTNKYELPAMTNLKITELMMTDGLSFVDFMIKALMTIEKRLMINLRTVKSANDDVEFQDVAIIKSEFNTDNDLKKSKRTLFFRNFDDLSIGLSYSSTNYQKR